MFSVLSVQREHAQTKSVAVIICNAFFVLLCSGCFAENNHCPPFATTEKVTIKTVVDGDTVHLNDGRKVRLLGINAPELGRNGKPDQAYARQATLALREFLGSGGGLLYDQDRRDNHGRTLAHLYNSKGQSAEAYLLRSGLAWHVAIPPNLSLASCLKSAEQQARHRKLGLWQQQRITQASKVAQGGFQRISGELNNIQFGKRGWWLDFGPQLSVVIYPEHQHRFNRQHLSQLQGQTITLRGWVYRSKNPKYQPWRIKLETPYGLEN
ncbi:thermonuclease family protein [bacterium SCSIO 12696]|nr:thermonuclease family protein [bacterium SCSIO 12696]